VNLRRQLLLVSLLTLILPWAGCQFIRETESALRQGQQYMLGGTAQAIADSLSQFPYELLSDDSVDGQLYAHPLLSTPLIDGYPDDWTIPDRAMASMRGSDGRIHYVLGQRQQHWYLYVEVQDASVIYRESGPSTTSGRSSDFVSVISSDNEGERTVFHFAPEAPGKFTAIRQTGDQEFDETRIEAYWRDTAEGYQLEVRIPRNLTEPRLGVSVFNTENAMRAGVSSASFTGRIPGPVVTVSPVLESVAAGYVQPGLRLIITDKDGWRLAVAGNISSSSAGAAAAEPPSGWLRLVYNLLLEPGAEAALAEPAPTGREMQSYISEALGGKPATRWFRSPDTGRAVVSVAQPIWSGNVQTGVVILQQGTDAILSLTNQVLTRLIILTLIATVVAAAVLLGYASWLSIRIRHLSEAAENALDDKRLHSSLPSALAGDEVGDLSRSFSSVLRQLGTYNDYLQSLAGKLSHELRTPLTIVRSSLENLEHEPLSNDALEYTARAMEGTDRLQNILNAMSEANRTEAMIESAEPEDFNPGVILESTVSAYADAWPERRFEFSNEAPNATIHGSPELVIQMLDKLVDNAVDFTNPDDLIQIALATQAGGVIISVSNPGPPLPDDMRAELFHSMVSVRKDDNGKHLGFGLFVARLIAEGHNGSISADNTETGVRFSVHLPIVRKG
jgi:two-component system sensor histidine kinase ChvG